MCIFPIVSENSHEAKDIQCLSDFKGYEPIANPGIHAVFCRTRLEMTKLKDFLSRLMNGMQKSFVLYNVLGGKEEISETVQHGFDEKVIKVTD